MLNRCLEALIDSETAIECLAVLLDLFSQVMVPKHAFFRLFVLQFDVDVSAASGDALHGVGEFYLHIHCF